ncbi:hypothetical protein TrST_g3645 [Triparma strigata]|uniref:Pentatricopeptide repeat-containing protein n=1 Tax=Triparma strigata TaxID=1606541 RepID=A0A9W7ERF0_9STRA|nr:hypothetical protein TrST_g3645 [Triparma strigata]
MSSSIDQSFPAADNNNSPYTTKIDDDDDTSSTFQYGPLPTDSGATFRVVLNLQSDSGLVLGDVSDDSTFLDVSTRNFIGREDDKFKDGANTATRPRDAKGVYVAYVASDSPAFALGVRPGDLIKETSATVGDSTWPLSTIKGLQTSLQSRARMASTVSFVLNRVKDSTEEDIIVEEFELQLNKPIGLELTQNYTPNGRKIVCVSKVTDTKNDLNSVKVGDRVVAVEAAFGGRFWPHSTVDGVVGAVNGRLPGQSVRIKFARDIQVGKYDVKDVTSLSTTAQSFKELSSESASKTAATGSATHKLLLTRSCDIIKNYVKEHIPNADNKDFLLPARAADSVLTVLAEADAQLDSITLATVMGAYLVSRESSSVARAFEAATGVSASGRTTTTEQTHVWFGKDGKTHRVAPNIYAVDLQTGTALLRAHALAGDFKSAVRVLKLLLSWSENGGIKVDSYAWNVALSAARTASDYLGALKLYETIPAKMRTQATYNTMLSLHARNRDYEEAEKLFQTMRSSERVDSIAVTAIMKSRADARDLEGVTEIFEWAKAQNFNIDLQMYNTLLLAFVKNGEWQGVNDVTEAMSLQNIEPDAITYSYLMNGLLNSKKYGECLSVFESALDVKKAVSSVSLFTTAITAAARTKQFDKAMGLVGKMKMEGLRPNVKTLTSLVNACTLSSRGDIALEVWKATLEKSEDVDGRARLAVLRACCQQSKWDDALALLESGGDGQHPHIFKGKELMEGYDALMFAAISMKEFDVAIKVLEQFLGLGFIPSNAIMVTFIRSMNIANRSGVSSDSVKFLYMLIDRIMCRKIKINGSMYSFLLHRMVDFAESEREAGDSDADVRLRQMCRMLVDAKKRDGAIISSLMPPEQVCVAGGWAEIFDDNELVDDVVLGELETPPLLVRVNAEERSKVGAAEQRVLRYARRRRAKV